MERDREVKIVLGFAGDKKEFTLNLPDDEPTPWDLNTKFAVVGKPTPRIDARAKVTGKAKYSHDINLPGLLFGGFARCPYAKAKIIEVDLSAAKEVKGVLAAEKITVEETRYANQPVAAIAAETRQALEEAIEKIKIRYEKLPHVARFDMALMENSPAVHKNRENIPELKPSDNAEATEKALATAHAVVEATVTTQVQLHCSLETHGVTAKWDGDKLTVWASTQSTFGVRDEIAQALKVEAANVTVLTEFMGGGFGSKFGAGYSGQWAARLAKATGRPVKIMLNREEELTDTGNRPDSEQVMKLGVTAEGKIAAYRVDIRATPGVGRGAGVRNPLVYDFPGATRDVRAGEVPTNAGPQAAMRAPGHPQGSFGVETIMDLAAEKLGLDPLEFRMRNDSHPVRLAQYKDGAARIGWNRRQPNGSAKGRMRRGLGVACSTWGVLGGPRAEVLCKILKDGSVHVRNGAQDLGTGTKTLLQLVCAEELGVKADRVRVSMGDTNDPIGPGSGGSTMTPSIAPAARQAAFLAGIELKKLVAQHFSAKPEDFVTSDGKVAHVSDAQKKLSFEDACRLIDGEISAMGKRKRNYDAVYRGTVGGVQFAEVEVDCDFGNVRVVKIVALQDCGIVINRLQTESQLNGGVIQGLSYALFEERVMDRALGQMVNADMEFYKIAGMKDMPEIETVLYDVANGGNNTSAVGIGEPACVPTASAIAGAVHNAIGVRVKSLPMTPDRVLMALAAKEKGR